MDDIFSGSDFTFSDPSSDTSFVDSFTDPTGGSTTGLDGGSPTGLGDTPVPSGSEFGSDASNPNNLGSTTAGTGFNWGSLIGPGLGAISGFAQAEMKAAQSKEDWKQKFAYEQKLMALQEQYYQAHGQQLAGAMQNFKQYAPKPGSSSMSPLNGGMMAPNAGPPVNQQQMQPQQPQGLLNYGY